MPLSIEDDTTTALVAKLAALRGTSQQEAVKQAVQAELDRAGQHLPYRERLAQFRLTHPLPESTGLKADKAFFDELSGDL